MELVAALFRFTPFVALGASNTVDALMAALPVSLILVVGASWWIFRRR